MKNLIFIVTLVIVSSIMFSCKDIIDLGDNINKKPVVNAVTKDDSLAFLQFAPINFGDVRANQIVYRNVVFNNISNAYTVNIYKIKLNYKSGFELYPDKGFPVVFLPFQNNAANRFVAKWNASLLTPGNYKDTVYLNDSQQIMLIIEGNILN